MGPWERWWKRSGWALTLRIGAVVVLAYILYGYAVSAIQTRFPSRPPNSYSGLPTGLYTWFWRSGVFVDPLPTPLAQYEEIERKLATGDVPVMGHTNVIVYQHPQSSGLLDWSCTEVVVTSVLKHHLSVYRDRTISLAEQREILNALDRKYEPMRSAEVGGSPLTTVVIPYREGVIHNYLRLAALCIAVVLPAAISDLFVRQYRKRIALAGPECANCGYSLIGLAGGVCPECGHDRGAGA